MPDCHIPLRRFGEIVAHAIVDADDFARLSAFRWCIQSGYAVRYEGKRARRFMHHEVLGKPEFVGARADHINLNRLDNRKSNLRWITNAENQQNRTLHRSNRSGFRGVSFDRRDRRWRGEVRVGGKKIWRRYFDNQHDANAATAAARRELLPYATA